MRVVLVLLAAVMLSSAGCGFSFLLATSGKDVATLPTQEQVREEFGTPVASGTEDGKVFEDFHTRRKIADWRDGTGYAMGYAMTLGLIELYTLPRELFRTSKRSVLGQDLRFIYDETGKVIQVRFDGEPFPLHARQKP